MVERYKNATARARDEFAQSCIVGLVQLVINEYPGSFYLGSERTEDGGSNYRYRGGKIIKQTWYAQSPKSLEETEIDISLLSADKLGITLSGKDEIEEVGINIERAQSELSKLQVRS